MLRLLIVPLLALLAVPASAQRADASGARFALAVHGGAGVITRASLTAEDEAAVRAGLTRALEAGHAVLREGGTALDAVTAAVVVLEDDPSFNAGRGAVLTNEGTAELDASLMRGRDLEAGAVAGVRHVRNPIRAARLVMEASPHVLLAGDGADAFAEEQGLEPVENAYFLTERRREALERLRARERSTSGHVPPSDPEARGPMGTVGAVALDQHGDLAAATSTGGMTNKRWGRVGDSPLVGAGTYADNETCAVSATGHGEFFIRLAVAHAISARMAHLGESVEEAARAVVHGRLAELGGTGGVIAMDREGRVAMPFNTEGMYRGTIDEQGRVTVLLYGDE